MTKNIFAALFIFLTPSLHAIGGFSQSDLVCAQDAYPGVGLLTVISLKAKTTYDGTVQLLPHSNGTLAITAKHTLEDCDNGPITVHFQNETIPVVEVFPHPSNDIALLRLARSANISEDKLPQFPDLDFLMKMSQKKSEPGFQSYEANIVGYGLSSEDHYHPGLLLGEDNLIKRTGKVILPKNLQIYKQHMFLSLPWYLKPKSLQSSCYTGPGDSGGPLLIDNRLIGIISTSSTNIGPTLNKRIKFITPLEEKLLRLDGHKCFDSLFYSGFVFSLYFQKHKDDFSISVRVYNDFKSDPQHLERAKKKFLENFSVNNPWKVNRGPKIISDILNEVSSCREDCYIEDKYVNIVCNMHFIKDVYKMHGFDASLINLAVIDSPSYTPEYLMATKAVQTKFDYLNGGEEVQTLSYQFEEHIRRYIRAKRSLGIGINRYNLLEDNPFAFHLTKYVNDKKHLTECKKTLSYVLELTLSSPFLPSLKHLQDLKRLNVTNTDLTCAEPVRDLPNLRHLNLSGTLMMDLEDIQHLTKLATLNLSNTPLVTVEGIEKLQNLRKLKMRNTKVTSIKKLLSLPKLQYLDLRSNPELHDNETIEALIAKGCEVRLQ